ncbi:hypothetical protein PR048_000051 [Dryococelus australis]|uniref:Uncharacterized protein n=1 Tax=Dryococelus australis TaxID=614101 RepID=A0ABQ9IER9_9NEOP|nr:hypothetical protein PR048_000051 [Dryococelus australis]
MLCDTGQKYAIACGKFSSYSEYRHGAYDLATQCPARSRSIRRHTIVAATSTADAGTQSLPHSRPQSRGPTVSSASSDTDYSNHLACTLPEMSWSRNSLQDELLHSFISVGPRFLPYLNPQDIPDRTPNQYSEQKNWQQAMECVSLTLEEIVHIRSVLTKAELESLPVEGHVKEDVEKRKLGVVVVEFRGRKFVVVEFRDRKVAVVKFRDRKVVVVEFRDRKVFVVEFCGRGRLLWWSSEVGRLSWQSSGVGGLVVAEFCGRGLDIFMSQEGPQLCCGMANRLPPRRTRFDSWQGRSPDFRMMKPLAPCVVHTMQHWSSLLGFMQSYALLKTSQHCEGQPYHQVCFLCLKTRFGLFGPRGHECKLCKRTICSRCSSKMRIPTEHFSQVPVYALSPGLSSPEEEVKDSFPRSLMNRLMVPQTARNSVGSAPSSPHLSRVESASAPGSGMGSSMADSMEGPISLPAFSPASTSASERRSRFNRAMTVGQPQNKKEKLKGLQMIVCHDCKMMVIQIIKTSRTSRNNAIRNLTLNLSPVY